jgi:hypothetical protein
MPDKSSSNLNVISVAKREVVYHNTECRVYMAFSTPKTKSLIEIESYRIEKISKILVIQRWELIHGQRSDIKP